MSVIPKAVGKNPYQVIKGTTIGYIDTVNLLPSAVDFALETVQDCFALILDVRGYPKGTIYQIASRLTEKRVDVAVTRTPLLMPYYFHSPSNCVVEEKQQVLPSSQWKYKGKVVVLVNEETISHAEHSCLYLESCADVVFIGSATNGSNGNVTNCVLPGGILVAFTGLGALHANGSQLQRKGIQPSIVVKPTIEGIREGNDEILEAAIKYLKAQDKQ